MYLLDTEVNPTSRPYRSRPQKPLLILQDFLRRNRKVMEVVFTRFEYKDAASCRSTFAHAIKKYDLGRYVSVHVKGSKVYLEREDRHDRER